jgi:hypothetical protein
MWIHADFEGIGFLHLLFNMMTLYYFGKIVEQEVGVKHFLIVYIGGGIVAGLSCLTELWLRYMYSGDIFFLENGMVGASGSVLATVAVFVLLNPHSKLYLMFIPVGIPANRALALFIGVSIIMMFFEATNFIAHSAHIGGMVFGYVYTKLFIRPHDTPNNVVPFPGSF